MVIARSSSTIPNDGQPHDVSFSSFTATDLSSAHNAVPALVSAGQNAISITQADSDGNCSATSYQNAPYPANHPTTPVLQTFRPGVPLIFNW
jgi:hypothetical protein